MNTVNAVALAPFIMLAASLINGIFGRGLAPAISGMIGSVATGLAFVLALVSFAGFQGEAVRVVLWDFLPNLPVAFAIDQLSLLMVLIITFVGLLINIYSIGYMKGDEGLPRYFSG